MKRWVQQAWVTQHPFTVVVLALSILSPLVALLWSTHSLRQDRALKGLPFQLLSQSRLIQSFVVDSEQAVPAIWSRRLGADEAMTRWASSNRKLWWMAWLEDGEPLLLISGPELADPSTFHFADALHRDAYLKKRSSQDLKPSGLEADCLSRLNSTTAVMWSPSALVPIAGPAATVMSAVSHGCISLSLEADILSFRGPVAPRPFSAAPPTLSSSVVSSLAKFKSTPSDQGVEIQPLLQLRSRSSDRLLSTLAGRKVIRDQLEKRYGVPPRLLAELLKTPMEITIRPERTGPYRAGLHVVFLLKPSQKKEVEQALATLSVLLRDRGMISTSTANHETDQDDPNRVNSGKRLVWMKGDQRIGGWLLKESETSLTLQLSLGQSPLRLSHQSPGPSSMDLKLKMVPSQLAAIGWISPGWPKLVRKAKSLELQVVSMNGNTPDSHWDWVEGELALR